MLDRREFLAGVAGGALGAAIAGGAVPALAQEKQGEGAGKGGGGEDIPEPKRLDEIPLRPLKDALKKDQPNGISARTNAAHYKLYENYVKTSNKLIASLAAGVPPGEIRPLKCNLSYQLDGAKCHEIYFSNLGGPGGVPEGRLLKYLERDFGSFEKWAVDLKATAAGARGWVWLAFDYTTNRLFNFIGDTHNEYPIWDATPILALDVYEHAYWGDFLADKAAYVDAFLRQVDWKNVADRLDVELRCANIPGVE